MAKLSLYRGEKSKVRGLPIEDGQLILGTISDKLASIAVDKKNADGKLIRIELDFSNYLERIENLEKKCIVFEEYIDSVTKEILVTNENEYIVTDSGEKILPT